MLAFVLSPIGRWLAVGAVALMAIGGAYLKGRADCSSRAELRNAQAEVAFLRDRLGKLDKLARDHAARVEEDQKIIDELRRQADDTPDNPGACLDADGARRVRDIR